MCWKEKFLVGKAKQQTGLTDRTTGGRLLPFICGWLAQDPQQAGG